MIYTLDQFWEVFINVMEVFLFYILVHQKLNEKSTTHSFKMKQYLYLITVIFVVSVINFYDVSSSITTVVAFTLCTLFTFYFYNDTLFVQLFWNILYFVIGLSIEQVSILILCAITQVDISALLRYGQLRISITFLYITLKTIFILALVHMTTKHFFLSKIQKAAYIALAVTGIVIAHYLLTIILTIKRVDQLENMTRNLTAIYFIFLIFFLALLFFTYQFGITKYQNLKLMEQTKQQELERKQFQNILESTRTLREMKHNIEIHLDVIEGLIAQENTEELKSYIIKYREHLNHAHQLLSTGNAAIDSIVSAKLALAKENRIKVSYSILIPDPFPVDNTSLCALIGNMFNNAIESCMKLSENNSETNTWIDFYIKPYQNMILIHMDNSSDGIYQKGKDGSLQSTKSENNSDLYQQHGIGLKRMQAIVQHVNGFMHITASKERFIIHIILPLQEEFYHED